MRTYTEMRIYDRHGRLVKDNDDWYTTDYPTDRNYPGYTLAQWYAEAGEYLYWDGTKDGWKIGNNGPATATGGPARVVDFACLAIADAVDLDKGGEYRLEVYSLTGQRIWVCQGSAEPGVHRITWAGAAMGKSRLGSGVYLAVLTCEGRRTVGKFVVLR